MPLLFLGQALGFILLSESLFDLLQRDPLLGRQMIQLMSLLFLFGLLLVSLLLLFLLHELFQDVARRLLSLIRELPLEALEHLQRLFVLEVIRNREHGLTLLVAVGDVQGDGGRPVVEQVLEGQRVLVVGCHVQNVVLHSVKSGQVGFRCHQLLDTVQVLTTTCRC